MKSSGPGLGSKSSLSSGLEKLRAGTQPGSGFEKLRAGSLFEKLGAGSWFEKLRIQQAQGWKWVPKAQAWEFFSKSSGRGVGSKSSGQGVGSLVSRLPLCALFFLPISGSELCSAASTAATAASAPLFCCTAAALVPLQREGPSVLNTLAVVSSCAAAVRTRPEPAPDPVVRTRANSSPCQPRRSAAVQPHSEHGCCSIPQPPFRSSY